MGLYIDWEPRGISVPRSAHPTRPADLVEHRVLGDLQERDEEGREGEKGGERLHTGRFRIVLR